MNFFDRLFMTALMGKGGPHWGAGAVAAIFLFLCSIGVIIYGIVSGYWQWCVLGGIWAVLSAITAAVFIIINIKNNSNRW